MNGRGWPTGRSEMSAFQQDTRFSKVEVSIIKTKKYIFFNQLLIYNEELFVRKDFNFLSPKQGC